MTTLIQKLNSADSIADLWLGGFVAALSAQEALTGMGFYAVVVGERTIVAWLNGCRFEMPAVH
ncbi:hypothetical protein LB533_20585 [Mesorhizobium sp. BR1-1-13]|uniref:hypothetical protein n=1 Tax=Mesorhizobium sp. BR1-1-13 TaxID=2876656 RepID=UPI001CD07E4E|nr:hypothetical protein [Mesorhizobium sp. BR1-1-13]MBZ9943487.1 hypothetical protein [Mesorhizobium sp. BR1-1-13]